LVLGLIVVYGFYKWAIGYAVIYMKGDYDVKKKRLGKTLPPFPNGWYVACKSKELSKGATKAVDIAGQNLVLMRDEQGKASALHAYCAHMGANLAVGGKVVNGNCVECPFHGWLYNAETGQCVSISHST
jgi:cholesterol 7-desaturase